MIKKFLRHSLPVQAWASVCAIALLCLVSAVSSGVLAWISETDAQAINTAGSVRMAAYRINFQLATDFSDIDSTDRDSPDTESYLQANDATSQQIATTLIGSKTASVLGDDAKIAILITDMEARLGKLSAYLVESKRKHKLIDQGFDSIEKQWLQQLKPALLLQDKQTFYAASLPYVNDVNKLVSELQYRNERRQNWQQLLQFASLMLTLLIMMVGLYKLRRNVLLPVEQLISANTEFEQGQYNTRVSISGYHEFMALGKSFNKMAKTIDTCQASLEHEITIKTQHLVTANSALSLLYDFAQHLTTSQLSLHKLDSLITDFGNLLPHLELTLCLQNEVLNHKDSVALHSNDMQELCTKLACDNCSIKSNEHTKSYSIAQQDTVFGELRVRTKSTLLTNKSLTNTSSSTVAATINSKDNNSLQPSQRIPIVDADNPYINNPNSDNFYNENPYFEFENNELIAVLANLISTALSLRKQRQQEYQLVLFEERTTIARELHDSLAQSLSYLKIQISVLEKHLKKAFAEQQTPQNIDHQQDVWAHIEHIKTGLKSAYHELRDLLVTFRLTIDNDNFDEALHESASEFAQKGGFDIIVNNNVMTLNLTAAEQIDLIQIVREALSNISRHAHATNVAIDLGYNEPSTHIVMAIIDDGVGIKGEVDQSLHHGLMIMEERAHSLGGTLVVTDNEPKGTIIAVEFTPDFFKN